MPGAPQCTLRPPAFSRLGGVTMGTIYAVFDTTMGFMVAMVNWRPSAILLVGFFSFFVIKMIFGTILGR